MTSSTQLDGEAVAIGPMSAADVQLTVFNSAAAFAAWW